MKLKKLMAAVLSFSIVCGAVPFNNAFINDSAVYAEEEAEYTEGTYDMLTYKNYGKYIEITECDESATEVEIPSEINGVAITSIGKSAFYGCKLLTSITIPDSVTSIGESAFYGCELLTSITVPDSVTSIGEYAFYECELLTSITIPDSVTSIGKSAFYGCKLLTSITIPDSVTSIGEYAFYRCESLTSITIPDSVTSIGDYAFGRCESLTSIIIPDSVTSIGDDAFNGCISLTSITIPDSVTSIGDYAFFGCSSLTSITIPNSVTSIGECAFCKCENLTSISIPESVVDFGKAVFEGTPWFENKRNENPMVIINDILIDGMNCTGDIIIPEGVTKIASSAFCAGALGGYVGISPPSSAAITSVCLPKTLKTIDYMAFTRCENLKEVVILGKIEYVEPTAFFDCTKLESMVILNEDCDLDFLDSDFNGFSDLTVYGIENSNVQKTVEEQIASRAENNRIQTFSFSPISNVYGDINTDGVIDSSDASSVLAEYALLSTGSEKSFSQVQIIAADVNNDGAVDSSDASSILAYYAFVSTGGEGTLAEFLSK